MSAPLKYGAISLVQVTKHIVSISLVTCYMRNGLPGRLGWWLVVATSSAEINHVQRLRWRYKVQYYLNSILQINRTTIFFS